MNKKTLQRGSCVCFLTACGLGLLGQVELSAGAGSAALILIWMGAAVVELEKTEEGKFEEEPKMDKDDFREWRLAMATTLLIGGSRDGLQIDSPLLVGAGDFIQFPVPSKHEIWGENECGLSNAPLAEIETYHLHRIEIRVGKRSSVLFCGLLTPYDAVQEEETALDVFEKLIEGYRKENSNGRSH